MTPDLLPTSVAATVIGIDRSTLSRWVKDGRITPAVRFEESGGAMLFTRADVEALAAEVKADAA